MRLQLVGPMCGIEGWNYAAFNEAADVLRGMGHEVFNPAETAGGDTTRPRSFYMRASLGALLRAQAVVLLPGWESSPGARTEMKVALALGLTVFTLGALIGADDDWVSTAPDD